MNGEHTDANPFDNLLENEVDPQSRDLTNNYLVSHVPQLYGGMDTALRRALTRAWNFAISKMLQRRRGVGCEITFTDSGSLQTLRAQGSPNAEVSLSEIPP